MYQGDTSPLPPSGDERRDVLRQRDDDLAEAAESLNDDVGAVRADALEIDNEIAQYSDLLAVSNQDAAYMYCWVNFQSQHGIAVQYKLAEGWEVVQGDMSEARERRGVGGDTSRRLGDVLLMRIRKDRHFALRQRAKRAAEAREGSIGAGMRDLGERYASRGLIVHADDTAMNPKLLQTLHTRSLARSTATRMVDEAVRQGRMPGVPAPQGG